MRKKEQKHKVFQIPYHLKDAGEKIKAWPGISDPDTVILDLREHTEKAATQNGKNIRTFKLLVDVWQQQPQLINYEEIPPKEDDA